MNYKNEKEIQQRILERMSQNGFKYSIPDEEKTDLKLNNSHPFLIIDRSEHLKGLRHYIKENNKAIIEENSLVYSKEEIVDLLLNDFIEKYNKTKNNSDLYKLIFVPGTLSIGLKNEKGVSISRNYNVISYNNYANNEFTIIKEKRIEPIKGKGIECPDFAMYINGIPLIVFEVKTPKSGLSAAFNDYVIKKSYQKFILCIGTDGNDAFLTASKVCYFKWRKYGSNKTKNIFDDIKYFVENTKFSTDEKKICKDLMSYFSEISQKEKNKLLNVFNTYLHSGISDVLTGLLKMKSQTREVKNSILYEIQEIMMTNSTTGLEDLIEELIDNPQNLFFYLRNCILVDQEKGTREFLINHRVQQYYTIKKLNQKLKLLSNAKNDELKKSCLLNELVVHAQRSGKSITIRSAVNLIASYYGALFKKVYVCVPDLTILEVMKKTFKFNTVSIKRLKNRFDYVKSITEQPAITTFYLYNIQKTTDGLDEEYSIFGEKTREKYLQPDVLFIIDEVHFSQDKLQADTRRLSFPYASFLSFTATPKIQEKSDVKVNYTASLYADADKQGRIRYLDELILEDAIDMNIVLPVRFEKLKFSQNADVGASREIDLKITDEMIKYLNVGENKLIIEQEKNEEENKLLLAHAKNIENGSMTQDDLDHIIQLNNKKIDKKYLSKALKEAEFIENESLMKNLRKRKIDYIIKDMEDKKTKCYSTKGNVNFHTKAFIVVKSKEEAQKYMNAIKEMSGTNSTIYDGYHFGVDFSVQQQSTSNVDPLIELNNISDNEKIITYFESSDNDINKRVDILIVVDKYLMGYDNKNLVCVYCDKTIREPAKLFQLITRPATVRNGKKQGFFIDMTFSEDNYDTYLEKSLPYYNSGGSKIATLTEYEVEIQKDKIKSCLDNIRDILEIPKDELLIDGIGIYNKLTSRDKVGKSSYEIIKRKNDYFSEFKKINNCLEILINPKYYLDQFDEILMLSKVNFQYLNDNMPKNKDEDIIFDRTEIEAIILKSIRFFDFESSEDFNSFKIEGSTIKNDQQQGKVEFGNIVDDFKCKVAVSRYSIPLGFTDMITKWSEQITNSQNAKIVISEFIEEFVKPFEEEEERRRREIKEKFDGDEIHYISFDNLKKLSVIFEEKIKAKWFKKDQLNKSDDLFHNEKISEDLIEKIAFVYSKVIGEYIDYCIRVNRDDFNDYEVMVEHIKMAVTTDFESSIKKQLGENVDRSVFSIIRKDQKRIKALLIDDPFIIGENNSVNDNLELFNYLLLFVFKDVYFFMKNAFVNN